MTNTNERLELTITEAAKATGKDRRTITRYRSDGKFPNAHQTDAGRWVIPVTDLLAADLKVATPTPPDEPEPTLPEVVEPTLPEVELLRLEVDHLRQRLADKNQILRDRLADNDALIESLHSQLRHLEAGPPPASLTTGTPEKATEQSLVPVAALDEGIKATGQLSATDPSPAPGPTLRAVDHDAPLWDADEEVKKEPNHWARRLFRWFIPAD